MAGCGDVESAMFLCGMDSVEQGFQCKGDILGMGQFPPDLARIILIRIVLATPELAQERNTIQTIFCWALRGRSRISDHILGSSFRAKIKFQRMKQTKEDI